MRSDCFISFLGLNVLPMLGLIIKDVYTRKTGYTISMTLGIRIGFYFSLSHVRFYILLPKQNFSDLRQRCFVCIDKTDIQGVITYNFSIFGTQNYPTRAVYIIVLIDNNSTRLRFINKPLLVILGKCVWQNLFNKGQVLFSAGKGNLGLINMNECL